MCLAWVPCSVWSASVGAAKPIMGTLFTLVFVASALFLLAGRAVLGEAGGWPARWGAWMAPLLILMYVRYHLDAIAAWLPASVGGPGFVAAAQNAMLVIAAVAGALLIRLRGQSWQQMLPDAVVANAATPTPSAG
jgi:PAT family beta-lactamase induction signal transducer AmpG